MKRDLYQEVATRIVAQLEAGAPPWRKPWREGVDLPPGLSLPLRHCGKPYKGINIILLWQAAEIAGYRSTRWLTYKQAAEVGGQVRKGEKATRVYYHDRIVKSAADDKRRRGEEPEPGDDDNTRAIWFLREYCVFNSEQVDNLPPGYAGAPVEPKPLDSGRIEALDSYFAATGATIRHGGNRAFYSPALDTVQMPAFQQFEAPISYYDTLAHECVHWTSAPHRLDRTLGKRFGDHAYAVEELVAELGAAFWEAAHGLAAPSEPRPDHAAYLATWIKTLKELPRAIFTAASAASAAVEYLDAAAAKGAEMRLAA